MTTTSPPSTRPGLGSRRALVLGAAVSLTLLAFGGQPPPPGPDGTGGKRRPSIPPGVTAWPADLGARLWAAYESRGPDYEPRTDHLDGDGDPRWINRLILESSPYLVQHAHNPVNWYPWGPESFAVARRTGRPILLSIGYSTCHWCHVMERESFDDEEVARLLNERFVCIKVDREERPDVDEVYMTALEVQGHRGGWPMTSLLTSDGRPFFGGTYLPRAAFLDLLHQAATAWEERRDELEAQAARIAAAVQRTATAAGTATEVGADDVDRAVDAALAALDPVDGGFFGAPKFPHEAVLLFLLERALRVGDRRALQAVELSLDRMARGGIYDQVGGGFHRYATDARWLVPHFEKMLYNQAHLARAYLEAARLTGSTLHERVARQTLDQVLRDFTSPSGTFTSATDADSGGREGAFFVWTPTEIRAALPPTEADFAIRTFGVTEAGALDGRSILHLPRPLPEEAATLGLSIDELFGRIDRVRERLLRAREMRPHPLRDEKVVTAWNGMMITTLALAGDALETPPYLDAAVRAADELWARHRRDDGRLWRASLDGRASVPGTQDDYAFLTEALVTLFDVTGDRRWLARARDLGDVMVARFWDPEGGGFFLSEDDHGGRLPIRPKRLTDEAIPSGSSVAVRALAMLARRTGETAYQRRAEAALAALAGPLGRAPTAFAYLLVGADELLGGAAGPLGYAARGVVRARARVEPGDGGLRLDVAIEIAPGWHVNASRPLDEELVPTRLVAGEGTHLGEIAYPEPTVVTLGFREGPLAVYEDEVHLSADVALDPVQELPVARLILSLQACDHEKCLRPEEISLELPLP